MAQNVQPARDERSLGQLFGDLSRETATLVREEIALARAEITSKVPRLGKDMGMMVAGGALAYAGLLALIAAAIIGLAHAVDWWLSALIVGVVVLVVGYLLVQSGLSALRRENVAPKQTISTVKEDAQWIKDRVS